MHEDEHWAPAGAPPSSSRQFDRQSLLARAAALGLTGAAATAFADALTPAAFAEETTHSAGGGGTLRFRLENDISNLDPAFFPTEADEVVTGCVHEGLVTFKPGTFDVVNCLAETFTPSKSGLTFKFKLKEGVQFHGGYGEVTAADVKYSYERIAGLTKPNIHSPYSGDWSTLKEVKVTGKYTGVIILKEKFSPLLHSTLPAGSGLVLSKKALLKLGNKGIAVHPIGTGPYVFTKWTPKQKVTLTRNPAYAGSNKAYVKGKTYDVLEFLPIDDDSAAETGLRAGDIDFSRISSGSVDRFKKISNLKMYENASLDYQFLSLNVQDKVLKDVRLRQAIRLAVDVPSIIAAAYDDKWEQAYAIIPKSMGLGYWKDAPKYKRDVDAAKKLVAAAGADGITLRLAVSTPRPTRPRPGDPEQPQGHRHHRRHHRPGLGDAVRHPGQRRRRQEAPDGLQRLRQPARPLVVHRAGGSAPRWACGTGTTGARSRSPRCTTGRSGRPTTPSARRCTCRCRSCGTRRPAWCGSATRPTSRPARRRSSRRSALTATVWRTPSRRRSH